MITPWRRNWTSSSHMYSKLSVINGRTLGIQWYRALKHDTASKIRTCTQQNTIPTWNWLYSHHTLMYTKYTTYTTLSHPQTYDTQTWVTTYMYPGFSLTDLNMYKYTCTYLCFSDIVCHALEILYEQCLVWVGMVPLHHLTHAGQVTRGWPEVRVCTFGLTDGAEPVSCSLCSRLSAWFLLKVVGQTDYVLFKSGQVLLQDWR